MKERKRNDDAAGLQKSKFFFVTEFEDKFCDWLKSVRKENSVSVQGRY
jgi:hypothetical protein